MHLPRSDLASGMLVYARADTSGGSGSGSSDGSDGSDGSSGSDGGGGGGGGGGGKGGGGRGFGGRGGRFRGGFGHGDGNGRGFPPFGGGGNGGNGGGGGSGNNGSSGGGGGGGGGSSGGSSTTSNACPQTNGTTIGSVQSFTLLCDSAVGGDVINSTATDTFDGCTVACASFHPKCEAISFDGSTCTLKANLDTSGGAATAATSSTTLNGGIAQFPAASSNCASLGASTTQSNMSFNLFCNNIISGADLTQNNAASLQDCMDQCVSTSGCGAVSFDPTYAQGFKNCYLKTTGASAPAVDTGVDTAVMGNAVAAADSSSADSTAAAATSTTNAGVITVAPPQPSVVTQTVVSVVTSVNDSVSETLVTTELVTVSVLGGSSFTGGRVATGTATSETGGASTTAATPGAGSVTGLAAASSTATAAAASLVSSTDTGGGNSRAWIAAPVVGSVAAVMVVAVMFVLWGRRRRNNGLSSPLSPAFLFNRFRGGNGGGGDSGGGGFRNLSSRDSNTASFFRPQLPFGNSWRTSGKDSSNDSTAPGMSEKYGAGSGVARKVVDGESGSSSRTGTGHSKSVPLVIDTEIARSGSNKSTKGKANIVAVAVTTDAAERAVRDKSKESAPTLPAIGIASTTNGSSTSSTSSSDKPVPSRDLTANTKSTNSTSSANDVKSKVALRDSLNGLAQNRTTLDGIPIFLRE
ncbi:uncharacterized protein SPSK_05067 [Sporothrix schenckii 1099-18]|uniref:Apple domain-containing protein n=1 Tax=Sporothrix schenckii 1099-18 TaxID=1397361 RepID=A0A0F2LUQ6_SPOSC|nr:uncharacterized protein SPSK_05067 [Sporothrix schenckii 1099-18]KJR80240.1 hypothetical protein SPSK_05067 [Sporothrix schenckii 1099-18]